jgi:hypothetical protein
MVIDNAPARDGLHYCLLRAAAQPTFRRGTTTEFRLGFRAEEISLGYYSVAHQAVALSLSLSLSLLGLGRCGISASTRWSMAKFGHAANHDSQRGGGVNAELRVQLLASAPPILPRFVPR